jgi:hypothetical protein
MHSGRNRATPVDFSSKAITLATRDARNMPYAVCRLPSAATEQRSAN